MLSEQQHVGLNILRDYEFLEIYAFEGIEVVRGGDRRDVKVVPPCQQTRRTEEEVS